MAQSGTVLFYNISSEKGRSIRMLCLKMGLKIRNIEKSQYGEKLGALAGIKGYELTGEIYEGQGFDDEMMVMKGFSDRTLDLFLKGFRSMKIEPVGLKAVITPTTCDWDSVALHSELVRELEYMQRHSMQES